MRKRESHLNERIDEKRAFVSEGDLGVCERRGLRHGRFTSVRTGTDGAGALTGGGPVL